MSAVSVVIATRNRRDRLLATLPRHEAPTIVVDNASTDGTADAVTRGHPAARLIRLPENRGAAARNVGVAAAATPYVAFADDDSYWAPGALAAAAGLLDRHPRAALLSARVLVGAEGRLDPVSAYMASAPLGWTVDLPGPRILGFLACAAIVRRDPFLEVGGFNELLGIYGEEQLLALDLAAAGHGLAYVEALVVHHHPSPRRQGERRAAQEVRNILLTAWLRRRGAAALRITGRVCRMALRDRDARSGTLAALARFPTVVRHRQAVPPDVERDAATLEPPAHANPSPIKELEAEWRALVDL